MSSIYPIQFNFNWNTLRSAIQDFFQNGSSSALAGMGIAGVILAVILSFLVIWVIFGAAYYVFDRLGLFRMCKNAGVPSPGLMFIPVAKTYFMGLLAERSKYTRTGQRSNLAKIYLWCSVGSVVFSCGAGALLLSGMHWLYSVIAWALSLFLLVLKYYARYYIFADYAPDNDALFTVLTVLPLAEPILLLVLRDVIPVSVVGRRQGGQPKYVRGFAPQGSQQN